MDRYIYFHQVLIEKGLTECSFSDISHLCRCLGVNDYTVGYRANDVSHKLGARLKETGIDKTISRKDIFTLIKCGWMADLQSTLQIWSKVPAPLSPEKNNDCGSPSYPAFKVGYDLARQTRKLLRIAPDSPIPSMRDLCKQLGIPYIQTQLSKRIAGATVGTNNSRCIVINMQGRNSNPWRRRITVAHELEHLLWDSEEYLQSLNINFYDNVALKDYSNQDSAKWIEQRANAFAVEFLMPFEHVENKRPEESPQNYVRRMMEIYGVSFTSVKQHLELNGKLSATDISILDEAKERVDTEATDDWKGKEDFTYDYFPIRETPQEMRGRFAYWVCKSLDDKIISLDSAASLLKCPREKLKLRYADIIKLLD